MAIPRRRLAIGGGALVLLTIVGVGLVQARSVGSAIVPAAADAVAAPGSTDQADVPSAALRLRGRGLIVHGTVTIDSPKDGLITVLIDSGTITAVDSDSVTIAEKGGTAVTVAIDGDTRVRRDRKRAGAADLKVGDTVRVVSRVAAGGGASAKVIVVAPAPGG